MMNHERRKQRNRSSEGSIWSKVSFLFRLVFCVGMLPMIFPESEALVTNLRLSKSTTVYKRAPPAADLWMPLPPLRRLQGKSTTTAARNVERIRNRYSTSDDNEWCSSSSSSSFQKSSGFSGERQSMQRTMLSWTVVVLAACFLWLQCHHSWRLMLSVSFLVAHFALQEEIIWSEFSASVSLQKLGALYMAHLNTNPILTKSISAGVIGTIGDYTAQWIEHIISTKTLKQQQQQQPHSKESNKAAACFTDDSSPIESPKLLQLPGSLSIHGRYHLRRGMSMLADGFFISGPLMHFGYEIFEKILPISETTTHGPAASALAVMIHVFADSILLDSFFVASRFFTTGLMEGIPLQELLPQFKSVYVPSLKASWATSLVMCPIQFSCFRYLPRSFRVLSVNCIDVIWDAVLSFMAHSSRCC